MLSKDYVESVANSIIHQLEMGTAPWLKPWKPGERFLPLNPSTGKEYHGMNAVWLLSVQEEKGYRDNRWLTYKQANALDAQVNRGEKGTQIQYWKWTDDIPVTENGKPLKDDNGKTLKQTVKLQKPRVWCATVFNANQITGLPENIEQAVTEEWERHQEAEALLNDSKANIIYQPGNRAFYRPATDSITLPERSQFTSMDSFYATALHELGHWTGHQSRLDRDLQHPFNSEGYAKEELRAEIASLMLGEQLGIGHDPGQHVAYISSWIKVLKEDPREIFRAAADAEKIKQYLHGREMLQEKQETIQHQEPSQVMVSEADAALRTSTDRVYLAVPFVQKGKASALGAKWDRAEKSWYVPAGIDLEPFQQWLETKQELHTEPKLSPELEFAEALQAAGLVLNDAPVMDGTLHRVPVEGDTAGQKSGAYVGHLDGHPAGYINNFKTGYEADWKSQQQQTTLSATEKAKLAAEAEERKAARAKERDAIHEKTASTVAALWEASKPAQTHPYLEAKGVQSYGLRINTVGSLELTGDKTDEKPQQWSKAGDLLVPFQDIDGHFLGAQAIDGSGLKSFPRGSRLHGGHHILGNLASSDKALLAEGYATAASLHKATGLPVIVAFNSGNLPTIAQAYREKYQDLTLVIAGDNDHTKSINVGRQKAQEAALLVGGHVLLPKFDNGAPGSDWNDLAKMKGENELKSQLTAGLQDIDRKVLAAKLTMTASAKQQPEQKLTQPKAELVQSAGGRTLSI